VPARLKLKKILVPTDFSKFSSKALRYATEFATQFGASITLLHVVEPIAYPPESGYAPVEIEAVETTWRKDAKRKLEELGRKVVQPPLTARAVVRFGSPYHEITALAKEEGVDLIILATHGYTGLKHVFLGSTAEKVVRHAPCPVLTVREREHEFVSD
jgi:nucleotide-binding universal stress UspA family protein